MLASFVSIVSLVSLCIRFCRQGAQPQSLALCSSVGGSVLWAPCGMLASTGYVKDRAQLCESSPEREVAERKVGGS